MARISKAAAAAAKVAALNTVSRTALAEGGAAGATDKAIVAALNGKGAYVKNDKGESVPSPLAREILDAATIGYIASRLRATGSNLPDADLLIEAERVRKALNADGTGKLDKGQSRRSKPEQACYDSAKMWRSRLLKRAGLAPVQKRTPAKRPTKASTANEEAGNQTVTNLPKNVVPLVPPVRKDLSADKLAAWMVNIASAAVGQCETLQQVAHKTGAPSTPLALADAAVAFREAVNAAVKAMNV